MLPSIAHPTDLSPESQNAFEHALALALAARSDLDLLHVKSPNEMASYAQFPHVRDVLVRWGLMDKTDTPHDIFAKTGIHVRKVEISHRNGPAAGVLSYAADHPTGLIVVAPHEHDAFDRLIRGSISEQIALKCHRPALFIGEKMSPLLNAENGQLSIGTVLVPLAAEPTSDFVPQIHGMLQHFGQGHELHFLHVGSSPPIIKDRLGNAFEVETVEGPIVEAVLNCAERIRPDLIVMETAGHDQVLDMLQGSKTERVIRSTAFPLLSLPAK